MLGFILVKSIFEIVKLLSEPQGIVAFHLGRADEK